MNYLYREASTKFGSFGRLVDDTKRDAFSGELEGEGEAGRSSSDNENINS